jgi:hypothetical protein
MKLPWFDGCRPVASGAHGRRRLVAGVLLAAAAPAHAQVTAITPADRCNAPVLRNPSNANPLRMQAGGADVEAWIASGAPPLDPAGAKATGPIEMRVLRTRSAAANSARGCPAQASIALRLTVDDALATESLAKLVLGFSGGSSQVIPVKLLPHPPITWSWTRTPIAEPAGGCLLLPFAGYEYPAGQDLLRLVYPQGTQPILSTCMSTANTSVQAATLDAHLKGPVPIAFPRVMTAGAMQPDTTTLPSISAPGGSVPIKITLMQFGSVHGAPASHSLQISTPNGRVGQLDMRVDVPATPVFSRAPTVPQGVAAGDVAAIRLDISPAASPAGQKMAWRVTSSSGASSSRCFAATDERTPFDPSREVQVYTFQPQEQAAELRLKTVDAAGCAPATHVVEAWIDGDTSTRLVPFYSGAQKFAVSRP